MRRARRALAQRRRRERAHLARNGRFQWIFPHGATPRVA
jgi:hypothetical protein